MTEVLIVWLAIDFAYVAFMWWISGHRPATPAQSTPDDTPCVGMMPLSQEEDVCDAMAPLTTKGLWRFAGHNWVERPYAGILHFQPAFHVPGMTADAIASNLIQLCGGGPATVEAE